MNALTSLDVAQRRLRETLTNLHQAQAAYKTGRSEIYIHHAIGDIERIQQVIDKARQNLSKVDQPT